MVDIILRSESPDDLTAEQIDENFTNLKNAINDLIANPSSPVEIISITNDGNKLFFNKSDSTTIGPVYMPILEPHWRGDWQPTTVYDALDVFRKPGIGLYFVQIGHTSDTTFNPAAVDTASGNPLYLEMFVFAPAENIVYDMGFFYPGVLKDIPFDTIYEEPIVRKILIPITPAIGSIHRAHMRIAPTTAAQAFTIYQTGTPIGSINVAIGANEGTITITADVSLTNTDRLSVGRQAVDDATAGGLSVVLAAQQVLG